MFVNVMLRDLIAAANDVHDSQVVGGPAWIDRARFDIEAQAAADTPLSDLHRMLRSVLTGRFSLTVHPEKRGMPVFHLVRARRDGSVGPRLKRSAGDCGPTGRDRGVAPTDTPGDSVPCRAFISPTPIDFAGQTIGHLATVLGMGLQATVVDRTGLSGADDLQLSFSLDGADPDLPALPTADEQLGLRLERQRGPVDVTMVDRAAPPTVN